MYICLCVCSVDSVFFVYFQEHRCFLVENYDSNVDVIYYQVSSVLQYKLHVHASRIFDTLHLQ